MCTLLSLWRFAYQFQYEIENYCPGKSHGVWVVWARRINLRAKPINSNCPKNFAGRAAHAAGRNSTNDILRLKFNQCNWNQAINMYTISIKREWTSAHIHRVHIWLKVRTVDRVFILAELQARQISTRSTVRTEGHIMRWICRYPRARGGYCTYFSTHYLSLAQTRSVFRCQKWKEIRRHFERSCIAVSFRSSQSDWSSRKKCHEPDATS